MNIIGYVYNLIGQNQATKIQACESTFEGEGCEATFEWVSFRRSSGETTDKF